MASMFSFIASKLSPQNNSAVVAVTGQSQDNEKQDEKRDGVNDDEDEFQEAQSDIHVENNNNIHNDNNNINMQEEDNEEEQLETQQEPLATQLDMQFSQVDETTINMEKESQLLDQNRSVTFPHVPARRSFSEDDEKAARNVRPPSESSVRRERSLSRALSLLPTDLPSFEVNLLDLAEYWCHIILLETHPDRMVQHEEQLNRIMECLDATGKILVCRKSPGRFSIRMELTALVCELCMFPKGGEDHITHDSDLSDPDYWNNMKEKLQLLKLKLLRKDANKYIEPKDDALYKEVHSDDPFDEKLGEHIMMTADYMEVRNLLDVQTAIAKFRNDLTKSEKDKDSYKQSPGRRAKKTEEAVNHYVETLVKIFPAVTDETNNNNNMDESESSKTPSSNVPKELQASLLTDLYTPKSTRNNSDTLKPRLLEHVKKITDGKGQYSYENLRLKMRALLTKWSESILDIPVLVKLGYGNIPSLVEGMEDDDFSAVGEEEFNEDNHRTRSLRRIYNAMMTGAEVSVSEEDKIAIKQLAALASITDDDNDNDNQIIPDGQVGAALANLEPEPVKQSANAFTQTEMQVERRKVVQPPNNTAQPFSSVETDNIKGHAKMPARSKTGSASIPGDSTDQRKKAPPQSSKHRQESGVEEQWFSAGREKKSREANILENSQPDILQDKRGMQQAPTASHNKNLSQNVTAENMLAGITDKKNLRTSEPAKRRPSERPFVSNRALIDPTKSHKRSRESVEAVTDKETRQQSDENDSSDEESTGPTIAASKRPVSLSDLTSINPNKRRRIIVQSNESIKENAAPSILQIQRRDTKAKRNSLESEDLDFMDDDDLSRSTAEKDNNKPRQKRVPFTDEEKDAIRDGILKYGVGKWADMKKNDIRLRHRSGVQIKDKYRTMYNKGEI